MCVARTYGNRCSRRFTRETQVNGLQAAMEDLGMQVSLEVNLCLCFAVDYAFIANGPGGCCRR